jgi:hypothetical protein
LLATSRLLVADESVVSATADGGVERRAVMEGAFIVRVIATSGSSVV